MALKNEKNACVPHCEFECIRKKFHLGGKQYLRPPKPILVSSNSKPLINTFENCVECNLENFLSSHLLTLMNL